MKLVRLTSTENKAMFDNTLNDPISLQANAQVALGNVALASKPRSVIIDANNGVVKFNQGTVADPTGIYDNEFTIESGLYNAGNEATLLEGMEADLNDNQSTAEWENTPDDAEGVLMMNTQWAVVENKGGPTVPGQGKKLVDDDKIVIGYRKACTNWAGETSGTDPTVPVSRDFVSSNLTIAKNGTQNYNKLTRTAGSGDANSYMVGHTPLGWGPGGFALELSLIEDAGGGAAADVQGVFFGLTRTNHAANASAPTRAECKFGIHCSFVGENYQIYKENVVTDGGQAIIAGDQVLIRRNAGTFEAWAGPHIGASTADKTQMTGELDYTYRTNSASPLYPVIIIYGLSTDTHAIRMSYSPDPYLFMTRNKGVESIHPCLWDRFDVLSTPTNSVNLEIILSQDVALFLGFLSGGVGDFRFPNKRPPGSTQLVSRNSFGWKAQRAFDVTGRSESFYVQLLSAGCEGYDGLTSGRQNILAVIPKSDTANSLLYDVANPLFLEVGNAFPITLRNISARVLTEDGGELETDGLSVMTLLFK